MIKFVVSACQGCIQKKVARLSFRCPNYVGCLIKLVYQHTEDVFHAHNSRDRPFLFPLMCQAANPDYTDVRGSYQVFVLSFGSIVLSDPRISLGTHGRDQLFILDPVVCHFDRETYVREYLANFRWQALVIVVDYATRLRTFRVLLPRQ